MRWLVLIAVMLMPSVLLSQQISVADRDALLSALSSAKGGEVIALAAGNYGDLDLFADGPIPPVFAKPVTIKGAGDARPVFTKLKLTGARNLFFEGVLFDYTFGPDDMPAKRALFRSENPLTFDSQTWSLMGTPPSASVQRTTATPQQLG